VIDTPEIEIRQIDLDGYTIVETQLIKPRLLACGAGGDDVADLGVLVGDGPSASIHRRPG
jgi:hypothetical protein